VGWGLVGSGWEGGMGLGVRCGWGGVGVRVGGGRGQAGGGGSVRGVRGMHGCWLVNIYIYIYIYREK
jgi:hypothetical protein